MSGLGKRLDEAWRNLFRQSGPGHAAVAGRRAAGFGVFHRLVRQVQDILRDVDRGKQNRYDHQTFGVDRFYLLRKRQPAKFRYTGGKHGKQLAREKSKLFLNNTLWGMV